MMYYIKRISHLLLITLSVFFICPGCSLSSNKDYAFTTPKINFSEGVIKGRLLGSYKRVDKNNTVRGAPYELLIWFSTQEKTSCYLRLRSVVLRNIEKNTVIPVHLASDTNFKKEYKDHYEAGFNVENVNIDFADHELNFVYSFDKDCFTGEQPIKAVLKFKKNFQEREITFWDALMGI